MPPKTSMNPLNNRKEEEGGDYSRPASPESTAGRPRGTTRDFAAFADEAEDCLLKAAGLSSTMGRAAEATAARASELFGVVLLDAASDTALNNAPFRLGFPPAVTPQDSSLAREAAVKIWNVTKKAPHNNVSILRLRLLACDAFRASGVTLEHSSSSSSLPAASAVRRAEEHEMDVMRGYAATGGLLHGVGETAMARYALTQATDMINLLARAKRLYLPREAQKAQDVANAYFQAMILLAEINLHEGKALEETHQLLARNTELVMRSKPPHQRRAREAVENGVKSLLAKGALRESLPFQNLLVREWEFAPGNYPLNKLCTRATLAQTFARLGNYPGGIGALDGASEDDDEDDHQAREGGGSKLQKSMVMLIVASARFEIALGRFLSEEKISVFAGDGDDASPPRSNDIVASLSNESRIKEASRELQEAFLALLRRASDIDGTMNSPTTSSSSHTTTTTNTKTRQQQDAQRLLLDATSRLFRATNDFALSYGVVRCAAEERSETRSRLHWVLTRAVMKETSSTALLSLLSIVRTLVFPDQEELVSYGEALWWRIGEEREMADVKREVALCLINLFHNTVAESAIPPRDVWECVERLEKLEGVATTPGNESSQSRPPASPNLSHRRRCLISRLTQALFLEMLVAPHSLTNSVKSSSAADDDDDETQNESSTLRGVIMMALRAYDYTPPENHLRKSCISIAICAMARRSVLKASDFANEDMRASFRAALTRLVVHSSTSLDALASLVQLARDAAIHEAWDACGELNSAMRDAMESLVASSRDSAPEVLDASQQKAIIVVLEAMQLLVAVHSNPSVRGGMRDAQTTMMRYLERHPPPSINTTASAQRRCRAIVLDIQRRLLTSASKSDDTALDSLMLACEVAKWWSGDSSISRFSQSSINHEKPSEEDEAEEGEILVRGTEARRAAAIRLVKEECALRRGDVRIKTTPPTFIPFEMRLANLCKAQELLRDLSGGELAAAGEIAAPHDNVKVGGIALTAHLLEIDLRRNHPPPVGSSTSNDDEETLASERMCDAWFPQITTSELMLASRIAKGLGLFAHAKTLAQRVVAANVMKPAPAPHGESLDALGVVLECGLKAFERNENRCAALRDEISFVYDMAMQIEGIVAVTRGIPADTGEEDVLGDTVRDPEVRRALPRCVMRITRAMKSITKRCAELERVGKETSSMTEIGDLGRLLSRRESEIRGLIGKWGKFV